MTTVTAIWWRDKVQSGLSQGDVVRGVHFFSEKYPPYLHKTTGKRDIVSWQEIAQPVDGKPVVVRSEAFTTIESVLVISHSCEIDKAKKNSTVLIIPIRHIDAFGFAPDVKASILAQKMWAMLPLPHVPYLDPIGDYVADFRKIRYVSTEILSKGTVVASMTDSGLKRLSMQLIAFFTRLEIPKDIADGIATQDA